MGKGHSKVQSALRVSRAEFRPPRAERLASGRALVQSSVMRSGSERSELQPSAESFAGVTLVQLAAVAAARAEGFSLEEVLDTEGLEPATYRAADVAYKSRLIDPAERERLSADYQDELARAEDRLGRKVSPLDEDVDAWVRFLGTYSAQSAPADWLMALGMTLPDLSRLSRTWKQRFDADEALRKRAEKSARDKKPYDVASLRVLPAKLVPSPFAKPHEKPALGDTAPFPTERTPAVKRWMPRVDAPAELPAISALAPNAAIMFDVPVKPAEPSSLAMTSPVFSLPQEDALPFVSGPEIPDEPPTSEEEFAALAPPRDALSGTSLAVDIPRGPATPFAARPPKEEKPAFKPSLSLEQHAALTVEIATYPAHALAILKRYGLTPPQKVDLDRHYQRIVSSDPAKQAAWHAAYGAHYATLVRMPRR